MGAGEAADGGSFADQARDKAEELAGQAREATTRRVESSLSQGKARAAATLGSVAQTLRQSTQQLDEQAPDGAARYVERAADEVQRLSDYLQNTDVHEIVDGVERAARRQPALFLGGAFALGLLGARFIKNSRRNYASEQRARRGDSLLAGNREVSGLSGSAARTGGLGNPYGGASSIDRDVTSTRGLGTEPLGTASTSAFGGAADRPARTAQSSDFGGSSIDPAGADRP
jgi:hypothetical protein